MAYSLPKGGPGTTTENNAPVGSAGQPIKKEVYERGRAGAINRRMKKKKDKAKK